MNLSVENYSHNFPGNIWKSLTHQNFSRLGVPAYYLTKFCQKLHEDKINWTEREKDASTNGNSVNNVNTRTTEFPQHLQG